MSEGIIIALITGASAIIGAVIASITAVSKSEEAIRTSQAITDTKIDELTREVREHNNFAKRMPVVEEQIKVINHRIDDLEEYNNRGGRLI